MKSILQTDDKCFICGRAFGTETHHCFGGANRRFSEKAGHTRAEFLERYGKNYL